VPGFSLSVAQPFLAVRGVTRATPHNLVRRLPLQNLPHNFLCAPLILRQHK
jgi:hypothetical protein